MSTDNTAQAMKGRKSMPKSIGYAMARGLVSVLWRAPDCIVSMVCCYTGEHKAAKNRLSGQHPTANRRYLILGVTWTSVALLSATSHHGAL